MVIVTITNSDLNRPCFAWHPYGKSGLFKTKLIIGLLKVVLHRSHGYFLESKLRLLTLLMLSGVFWDPGRI